MWALLPLIWDGVEGAATLVGLSVGVKALNNNTAATTAQATASNSVNDTLKFAAIGFGLWYLAKKVMK